MIVLLMILRYGIANGVGGLVAYLAVFVGLGFFLFLMTFVLLFTHDDGSIDH